MSDKVTFKFAFKNNGGVSLGSEICRLRVPQVDRWQRKH